MAGHIRVNLEADNTDRVVSGVEVVEVAFAAGILGNPNNCLTADIVVIVVISILSCNDLNGALITVVRITLVLREEVLHSRVATVEVVVLIHNEVLLTLYALAVKLALFLNCGEAVSAHSKRSFTIRTNGVGKTDRILGSMRSEISVENAADVTGCLYGTGCLTAGVTECLAVGFATDITLGRVCTVCLAAGMTERVNDVGNVSVSADATVKLSISFLGTGRSYNGALVAVITVVEHPLAVCGITEGDVVEHNTTTKLRGVTGEVNGIDLAGNDRHLCRVCGNDLTVNIIMKSNLICSSVKLNTDSNVEPSGELVITRNSGDGLAAVTVNNSSSNAVSRSSLLKLEDISRVLRPAESGVTVGAVKNLK